MHLECMRAGRGSEREAQKRRVSMTSFSKALREKLLPDRVLGRVPNLVHIFICIFLLPAKTEDAIQGDKTGCSEIGLTMDKHFVLLVLIHNIHEVIEILVSWIIPFHRDIEIGNPELFDQFLFVANGSSDLEVARLTTTFTSFSAMESHCSWVGIPLLDNASLRR